MVYLIHVLQCVWLVSDVAANSDDLPLRTLTSGILVQQRLEIGVENLQKKWNIK